MPRQQIQSELEETQDVIFLEDGYVDFGFQINNQPKYVVRKKRCTLGIFEAAYERRAYLLVRAKTKC